MGLDEGLIEIGSFGYYQIKCYILLIGSLAFSAYYSMSYVFTAADQQYRCLVPECEKPFDLFSPSWIKRGVPFLNDIPDSCYRYKPLNSESNCSSFLRNETIKCDQYAFESNHTSILNSFDLYCKDNKWKLTIVGTINNLGQFLGMPIIGYISDRFGRKTMLVWGLLLSSIVGTIKSFSPNYITFLCLEMLDAIVGDGIYSGGIIIGAEYAGPDRRDLVVSILSSAYSLGEVILATAAWLIEDWRYMLRAVYLPGLLFISYYWLLPESMRWLVTKGRKEEALQIFEKMETTNNRYICQTTKSRLFSDESSFNENGIKLDEKKEKVSAIKEICRSSQMLLRVTICSYIWITHTTVFFGLSINSVSIAGNSYINFILVSLAEIPGYIIAALLMKYGGRKITLSSCLALSASSCIVFHFLPQDYKVLGQVVYFMGKCSITASFTILYMFTTELFPTNLRHTLLAVCSMFGRIGSMIAPQAPLMAQFVDPLLIFGGMALIAGLLVFYFPETANKKLPDNVREASQIGNIEKQIYVKT